MRTTCDAISFSAILEETIEQLDILGLIGKDPSLYLATKSNLVGMFYIVMTVVAKSPIQYNYGYMQVSILAKFT